MQVSQHVTQHFTQHVTQQVNMHIIQLVNMHITQHVNTHVTLHVNMHVTQDVNMHVINCMFQCESSLFTPAAASEVRRASFSNHVSRIVWRNKWT